MRLSIFTDEVSKRSERAIELAKSWDVSHVEVRSLDSGRFPRASDNEMKDFHRRLTDAGLAVSGVSPGLFKCAVDDSMVKPGLDEVLPRACEWARRWGTDVVSSFGFGRRNGDAVPQEVVDLVERMERLEQKAPELFEMLDDEPRREAKLRMRIATLEEMLKALGGELEQLRILAGVGDKPSLPTAADIGAVDKSGDHMTGALVIRKGGLEVVSGGIQARGVNVNTLEAANMVRAPKVITEALELRGELTVDNISRVLQIRQIEGRHASGRKDGPLHLNGRSGSDVVVGRSDKKGGMQVQGTVNADKVITVGADLAERFVGQGLEAGDVVRLAGSGRRIERSRCFADPAVVGVVSSTPGVLLGQDEGQVPVALSGTVFCKVDARDHPVAVGDLLVSAELPGHAQAIQDQVVPDVAVIGRALSPLSEGIGTISILVR